MATGPVGESSHFTLILKNNELYIAFNNEWVTHNVVTTVSLDFK